MSNNIYDIMKKLNAVSEQDVAPPVSKQGSTLLESTMKEVLNEKYMGFDKTVAAKGKKLSERKSTDLATGEFRGPRNKGISASRNGQNGFTGGGAGATWTDPVPELDMGAGNKPRASQTANQEPEMDFGATGNKPRDKYNRVMRERVSVGAEYELDPADMPMPGNKLSPKDQYQAIMKDVEHVQQGRRGLKPEYSLEKDSKVGRFAAPGYGDQGQFFQEDDMEEGNKFTGNLAKARAAGKKRADLDGDGDMETVREGAKPDYIDLDKDGNRKESMKKAAADKKKRGVAEGTKETSTGRVHKAEPGGYGRKDDEDESEDKDKKKDKKAEPAVKRGRGRPKKDADSDTGEVKKWDTDTLQSWIVGSVPKKLPGKASVKHKIKDEPDEKLDEVAPPGAKAERMVKHIKKGYAKDGKVTPKEKGIAYATAWKAKKAGKVEESIPPGFPRELAKRIYEHYDGDMNSTLTAMWNVHNTVMESKVSGSKKKLSEGMTFEQSTTKPAQKPVLGTYKDGVWTADPPKKGEVGVPVPSPDEGAPVSSPSKKRPAPKAAKEDVSENKELSDVLKLAGMVEESVKVDECGMSPIGGAYGDSMTNAEGRMSISTNMSTDGNKTVTITADGDAAGDLMKMLKLAGINSDGGEDTDVEKMSEEKDDRYEANTTPEEEVLPVQVQLKGGNGEVAGKEKKMTPHGYKFADNPLAMTESMTLKLMKEYESIKKTK